MVRALLAAGARVILLDMRGVGASDKPRDQAAYGDSAMARDVVALIEHLRLVAVDVIGFSMGAGTAARLLILRSGTTPSKTQFWSFRKAGRFPTRCLAR